MNIKLYAKRKLSPLIKIFLGFFPDLKALPNRIRGIIPFISDLYDYRAQAKSQNLQLPAWKDTYPQLEDRYQESGCLPMHYFFQDLWAAKLVYDFREKIHYDIGSSINGFVAHIAVFCNVKVIDIRPQNSKIDNVEFIQGDITNLNLNSDSVMSLSCLHAAEHIGLGRYGDIINPLGTYKATKELQRVLAKKGNLYFSVPIGRERICFNAHRIFSPDTILDYFCDLHLQSFSAITDDGNFVKNARTEDFIKAEYACGLFHFKKM